MTVKARKDLISDIVIYVLRAAELAHSCSDESDKQEIKVSAYELIYDRIEAEIKKGEVEF